MSPSSSPDFCYLVLHVVLGRSQPELCQVPCSWKVERELLHFLACSCCRKMAISYLLIILLHGFTTGKGKQDQHNVIIRTYGCVCGCIMCWQASLACTSALLVVWNIWKRLSILLKCRNSQEWLYRLYSLLLSARFSSIHSAHGTSCCFKLKVSSTLKHPPRVDQRWRFCF